MKHDELRAIAHNIADSLASGCCLMIGVYSLDVFLEAAGNVDGSLAVDFLNGRIDGVASAELGDAVQLFSSVLPDLCRKHSINRSAFRVLSARYHARVLSHRFTVTVEDYRQRRSTTEYGSWPGQRIKVVDSLGRLRLLPVRYLQK